MNDYRQSHRDPSTSIRQVMQINPNYYRSVRASFAMNKLKCLQSSLKEVNNIEPDYLPTSIALTKDF